MFCVFIDWNIMFRIVFYVIVFFVGLLVVCWIGIGYVLVYLLGVVVVVIIVVCYIVGGVELYCYCQVSNGLCVVLNDLFSVKESFVFWLECVLVGLCNVVCLCVEGECIVLFVLVLILYLVGLLVLLGMFGILLGMMDILCGIGLVLQSVIDMVVIRGLLVLLVQGFVVVFGILIVGVVSLVMFGLLVVLLCCDCLQVVQQLDCVIVGDLYLYLQVWQCVELLCLLQVQFVVLLVLVDCLQVMMQIFERYSMVVNECLLFGQVEFLIQSQVLQEWLVLLLQQLLCEGVEVSVVVIGGVLWLMVEIMLVGLVQYGEVLYVCVEWVV